MSKRIFIDGSTSTELSITATNDQNIEYFDFSVNESKSKKSNIYLCTVSRVEPSLQAAFVDYGEEKKAFLPFDEIHPSYFKIPHNIQVGLDLSPTYSLSGCNLERAFPRQENVVTAPRALAA